jgi:gamma-glutamylcyclotransferase (GGCT)/AIG2-like uncharacterized protein YtfP
MTVFVFIYGTLKRNERNHARLKDATFICEATTKAAKYTMLEFDSSSSPGQVTPSVKDGGTDRIGGEVYEVRDELLADLDQFEQVGIHYKRIALNLDDGQKAQIYLHLPKSSKQPRSSPLYIRREGQRIVWKNASFSQQNFFEEISR